jgi:hypothetical protein
MIGVERLEEDSDGKALIRARRSAGSMSAFSGAGGMVYMEYRCSLSLFLSLFLIFISHPSQSLLTACAPARDLFFPALGRERVFRRNTRTRQRGIICSRNAMRSLLCFARNDLVHDNLVLASKSLV